MDDSSLMDIYEDLSVDKIGKMCTQPYPLNYTKPEPEEEESKIDLFMEALTVHTIDKVQSQLSELQKENQQLRYENAELRESKKQLSKNISSLFLTARQEIQKKEQEIAKLMLERMQENCESCRLKQVQHDLKHPFDIIPSSVSSRSTVCSKKDKPQSEIRNKLMQEISQSYSLSSCQGVASRKKQKGDVFDIQPVHKNGNNTVVSEPEVWKTKADEVKSYEDRKVAGSKQDSCIRNHHSTKYFSSTSGHQQPYVSTFSLDTSKESQSVTQKNKRTIPDLETQRLVKIQKLETPKISLIKTSVERTEKINSTKHTEKGCSNEYEHLSQSESKIASFDFNSSVRSNEPTVTGHGARKPKHFMFVGTSEHEKAVFDTSDHFTWSHFQGTFVSAETSRNHSAKSKPYNGQDVNENELMQLHVPQIHKSGTYLRLASSADIDTDGRETFNGNGSANHSQTEKLNCHLTSDCNMTSEKTSQLTKTSRDCTKNVISTSLLTDSSHTAIRTDNQALRNEIDTASCTKLNSFTKQKKIVDVDHDKNNCSSNESPHSQCTPYDENGQNDFSDELLFSVDIAEPTYITCTSNLILLGDEETTCTTITSPCKLQPSEFYPPGVRGDVHEGGSHARHIRGVTEVIKNVPSDKCHYFQSKHNNASLPYIATDENIQAKTWDNVSDERNSKNSCISGNLNCHKAQESKISHSNQSKESLSDKIQASGTENYPETEVNSDMCNNLEEIRNVKAEYTKTSQKGFEIHDNWANTVNDMFGTVFHKKFCTLKQEPAQPFMKIPLNTQEKTDSVTRKIFSGVSIPLKNTLTKVGNVIEDNQC